MELCILRRPESGLEPRHAGTGGPSVIIRCREQEQRTHSGCAHVTDNRCEFIRIPEMGVVELDEPMFRVQACVSQHVVELERVKPPGAERSIDVEFLGSEDETPTGQQRADPEAEMACILGGDVLKGGLAGPQRAGHEDHTGLATLCVQQPALEILRLTGRQPDVGRFEQCHRRAFRGNSTYVRLRME
ncbi:MAG: hypothetical protein H6675_00820 [Dehalococcoidia bacterium]|nr:hypothetical protein [Dehalococcoidia bacterium]